MKFNRPNANPLKRSFPSAGHGNLCFATPTSSSSINAYGSTLRVKERLCEDCDMIRTEKEFGTFLNCANCRAKGKPVRRKR